MVWVVEKKVIYHLVDLGFERVEIPIRVKFEFELMGGSLVPDTITKDILYNRMILEKRYPKLDISKLQRAIEESADKEILKYLNESGFMKENNR